MKKSITVSIPEPCHENWAQMTPTEKGKFCSVCTKEVVDFTSLTDEAIVKYATQNKKLCGRFKSSQLDRPITLERKSGISIAPIAASFLLPLSLLANNVNNNNNSKKPFVSLNIGSLPANERIQVTYQGTISDADGLPLSNVKIEVLETGQTQYSNKDGNYKITFLDRDRLQFSAEGFEAFTLQAKHFSEIKNITLAYKVEIVRGYMKTEKLTTTVTKEITGDSLIQKTQTIIKTISGTITDESGLPLPGANIIVKGTSNGTQSDFDGNYSINAPQGSTLIFSYIGYSDQEIKIKKGQSINVNMEMSGDVLGGLVVVGYSNVDISNEILGYPRNTYRQDLEREAEVAKRKAAYKQTLKFKNIKTALKKAARKTKRALHKQKNKS